VIFEGDCLEVMAGMEPESVDAVVTDPPYLLKFMGKSWDGPTQMSGHSTPDAGTVGFYQAVGKGGTHDAGMDNWKPNWMQSWHEAWAREAFRVAKPSAYLLAFGGTRTVHRMTSAIEDAGWIIRDMLVWAYASGFPKSKASLKPAWEPIVMARKPGPLRMLAIDECRIPFVSSSDAAAAAAIRLTQQGYWGDRPVATDITPYTDGLEERGRWPANVILTDPIFDGDTEAVVGGGISESGKMYPTEVHGGERTVFGQDALAGYTTIETYGDSGTYSRFFLIPKADRTDREPVLRTDRELPFDEFNRNVGNTVAKRRENSHPTVKPTELMRHLVRLVTPQGGTVLDPFLGSGTTGLACELEGFDWIGIEKEPEYAAIARARLPGTQRGLGLA